MRGGGKKTQREQSNWVSGLRLCGEPSSEALAMCSGRCSGGFGPDIHTAACDPWCSCSLTQFGGSYGSLIGCTCICAVCSLVRSACWTLSSGVQGLSLVGWDLRIIPGSSSCVAGQLLAPLPCPLSALLNKWAILGHANIQKAGQVCGIYSVNVFYYDEFGSLSLTLCVNGFVC